MHNAGKSIPPLRIFGILLTVLGVVWVASNLSPRYEWENYQFRSAKMGQGVIENTESYTPPAGSWEYLALTDFGFYTPDGQYHTGQSVGYPWGNVGDTVQIEYVPDKLHLARIVANKHRWATRPGTGDILTLAFGLVLLLVSMRKQRAQ